MNYLNEFLCKEIHNALAYSFCEFKLCYFHICIPAYSVHPVARRAVYLNMYLSPYYFTSPKGNLWYPFLLEYTHSTCLDDQNRKDSPCTASLWQYKRVSKPNSNYTMKHKQYFIQEKDKKMLLWKKWALARLNVQGPQNTHSLCSKKKKTICMFSLHGFHTTHMILSQVKQKHHHHHKKITKIT